MRRSHVVDPAPDASPRGTDRPPAPRAARAIAAIAAALLALLLGSILARAWSLGPVDDAYISLRYAAHWAGGEGLVFNPGERVEGFTNFLHVALEAAAIRLGAPPATAMRALGWIALAALAAAIALAVSGRDVRLPPAMAAIAALLVALNPIVLCWSLSGLEPVTTALLILAAIGLAGGAGRPRDSAASGAVLALAAMSRPEAACLAPALAVAARGREGRARAAAWFALAFGALFGAFFVARWWWFGWPFPNTFYAKLDYGGARLAWRGAGYVARFALAAPTLVLPAAVAVAGGRRSGRTRTLAIVAALYAAVVVYEGGDHFPLFRFLVPIVPLLALLALRPFAAPAPRATGGPAPASRLRRLGLPLAGLACLAAAAATGALARDGGGRSGLARFRDEARDARAWRDLGLHLREAAPPGASLATIAIGAVGMASGLRVVDPLGIVDPVIAHERRPLGAGYAGHEKFDVERVLALRPSYMLLLTLPTPRPVPEEDLPRWVWGSFNRAMLAEPRLRAAYRYQVIRLDDGFWGLHVRRDLPALPGR